MHSNLSEKSSYVLYTNYHTMKKILIKEYLNKLEE